MKRAVVLYMPVYHEGYNAFLEEFRDRHIYVISEEIISELANEKPDKLASIVRDPRRVSVCNVVRILRLLGFYSLPLDHNSVQQMTEFDEVLMPLDSFSEIVAHKFAHIWKKVHFKNCFLRWDMERSLSQNPDCADSTITFSDLGTLGLSAFVEKAKEEAAKSPDWWRQIGTVLVKDGQQILTAFNTHLPSEFENYFAGDPRANFDAGNYIEISKAIHAEAALIAAAAKDGISVEGGELFVTTFPCPPCANLIAISGIRRIYFIDGYSLVGAAEVLKEYGVEIVKVH